MDIQFLTGVAQLHETYGHVYNCVDKEFNNWVTDSPEEHTRIGCAYILAALSLRCAVGQIVAKGDDLDRKLAMEINRKLFKYVNDTIDDNGGKNVARLRAITKDIKNIDQIGNLRIKDVPILLGLILVDETEIDDVTRKIYAYLKMLTEEVVTYITDYEDLPGIDEYDRNKTLDI